MVSISWAAAGRAAATNTAATMAHERRARTKSLLYGSSGKVRGMIAPLLSDKLIISMPVVRSPLSQQPAKQAQRLGTSHGERRGGLRWLRGVADGIASVWSSSIAAVLRGL